MYGVNTKLIIETFLGIIAGIILTVPVHEAGHLVSGLITGYRFSAIGILGLYLYRDSSGVGLRRRSDSPIGQCIMRPDRPDRTPVLFVSGGILANLFIGAIFTWLGVRTVSIDRTAVCLSIGGIMAALGILNAIPLSRTNDASTFMELLRYEGAGRLYNRLMCIYSELEEGRDPIHLSAANLKLGIKTAKGRMRIDSGMFRGCTIAEELLFYRHLKEHRLMDADTESDISSTEKALTGERQGNFGQFRLLREESVYDI